MLHTPTTTYADFLSSMPGITGRLARYIYDQLEWEQPGIAMAAAISFMGTVKSRRFNNPFDISPLIYACIITDSGMGKSKSQEILVNLCTLADMDSVLMGKPKSDSAIVSALEKTPRKFLIWDELGVALSAISKSKASYEAQILSTLMELFSSGNRKYIGSEYSKRSQAGDRQDIDRPSLSVYGASTPERFFSSLSEDFVQDGLLSRWLLFLREPEIRGKEPRKCVIPQDLIDEIKALDKGVIDKGAGDIAELTTPKVQMIQFTPDAVELIAAHQINCKFKVEKAATAIERTFYTRLFEHCIKLCTIFSENTLCTAGRVEYAFRLGTALVEGGAKACLNNLFDNHNQKAENKLRCKILDLFEVGQTLTKTEIAQRHSRDSKARNQTIRDLVEEGILLEIITRERSSSKPCYSYKRVI